MADATDCIGDAAQKAAIAQVQAVPGQKVPGEMFVGQDIHCIIVRSYGGQLSVDAGDLPVPSLQKIKMQFLAGKTVLVTSRADCASAVTAGVLGFSDASAGQSSLLP